jgi:hypothetical protein
MCHFLRPERAGCPSPFDSVDAGLDGDLAGEMIAVTAVRACRSSAAKVRHARHGNPPVIPEWLQAYVLAAAAPGGLLDHWRLSRSPCRPCNVLGRLLLVIASSIEVAEMQRRLTM